MAGLNILDVASGEIRVAGATKLRAVRDIRTVVGPASYVQGTGLAVDLSAVFSELLGVKILRAYVTATKAADNRSWRVHEAGTDLFSNRKFRILCDVAPTPTGSLSSHVHNLTSGGVCGTVACSGTITHASTAAGTDSTAVTFAGTKPTVAYEEISATATNLSTITVEYEAVGVV